MNLTAVEFNKREISRLNVFFVQGAHSGLLPGVAVSPATSQLQGGRMSVVIRSDACNLVRSIP